MHVQGLAVSRLDFSTATPYGKPAATTSERESRSAIVRREVGLHRIEHQVDDLDTSMHDLSDWPHHGVQVLGEQRLAYPTRRQAYEDAVHVFAALGEGDGCLHAATV